MKGPIWFLARTPRERALIAGAAVLALCLLLWFAGAAARKARETAASDWRSAHQTLDAAQRLKPKGAYGLLAERLQTRAQEAAVGLEVAETGGQVEVTVASAPVSAVFTFLARLDNEGLGPSTLAVVENADATLQMAATLPASEDASP